MQIFHQTQSPSTGSTHFHIDLTTL